MIRSIFVGFVTFMLVFGTQNFASAIPCGVGGISGSTDCQDGADGSNDDLPAPDIVNNETFFGFDDWEYLSKYDFGKDELEEPVDVDWLVEATSGTLADGTWSFNDSVWLAYSDVMIVLNSVKHEIYIDGVKTKIYFSGYLLDSSIMPTIGTWDTGGEDLSHLTLYARAEGTGSPAPVPEPATMLLFGTGLAGLVGARIRKKKK